MSGCHAGTVIRCDSRADFGAYCGYSAAEEPFGACPCRGYSAAAEEPFRRTEGEQQITLQYCCY